MFDFIKTKPELKKDTILYWHYKKNMKLFLLFFGFYFSMTWFLVKCSVLLLLSFSFLSVWFACRLKDYKSRAHSSEFTWVHLKLPNSKSVYFCCYWSSWNCAGLKVTSNWCMVVWQRDELWRLLISANKTLILAVMSEFSSQCDRSDSWFNSLTDEFSCQYLPDFLLTLQTADILTKCFYFWWFF